MTTPITPVPRLPIQLGTKVNGEEVVVELNPPEKLKRQPPAPMWRTILIRFVIVLVICVVGLMLFLGIRQFNPMMIMGMVAILGAVGGALGGGSHLFGGSNPQGELSIECQDYAVHLREQRSNAHALGRHIHATQTGIYPHPDTLESRCGDPKLMWTTTAAGESALAADLDERERAESAQTNPWGTARIGVGYRRMHPYIKPTANDAPETYEPVQAAAYMRFIRTHNVIPDCPIGVDVFGRPFIVCAGDPDKLLGAARAMICSLADNHAPRYLQLGIITEDIEQWEWMKWLPHCLDPTRRDRSGPARLHWPSITDYARDQADRIAGASPHSAKRDNRAGPYRVIFVDIPGKAPEIPRGISSAGLADHTFVYVRHS
ncbi:hypothetical protein KL864_33850 [Mycolicibacterium goodii]|uniref:hypothetical protein n=1 Tax=Mycolicibacterium goodii TaxID=134601 RepID=UPI001BDC99ED|nr:hypothetical protein [Mycolicibacterium goodii]MBU8820851.1 hypothetical protein [Mycolicibacterium goodii]